jgi:hypothetical protein
MSRDQWRIDGELHGHSTGEVLRYLSDCADFEVQQDKRHRAPAGIVTADAEPRWLTGLRRWFGR